MLIVDGIIYSLQQHGGITVYFNNLIERLKSNIAGEYRVVIHNNSAFNVDVLPKKNYEARTIRLAERYRRCPVPAQASLIHSSYYRLPDRNMPVVTTVHDFIYERFASGPRKWLHSWQKFLAIRNSHAVICISESTRRDLLQFLPDIKPEKLFVVHNGVSTAFHPLELASFGTRSARPYVLFVGARSGYKNFMPLVYAMAGLRDLDLVCIGGGVLTDHEAAVVKRQLGGRFMHHMGVSDAHLNQFYNGAFCLVYPSVYEGFGIPLLEAMRAGCPVVAINTSSIPEVAGDAAQLLSEASPEALRLAILRLDQSGQRDLYRLRGLQRATLFSWDRAFVETCKVYAAARTVYE